MLQMGFAEDVERSSPTPPRTSRSRCSRRPCRPRSARSPRSTCTTRSRSPSRRRPRPPTNITQRYIQVAGPAEDGRADPDPRGRALRGDDRVRPHQAGHRGGRREAAGPRLLRGGHQRRHRRRRSASAPSPRSRTASSTSWSPPTSRPAASTSSGSRTCSTTTSRTTPSPTCTASAAPAAPGRSGTALLFVTPRERHLLKSIEKATRQKLDRGRAADGRGRQRPARREVPRLDHRRARRAGNRAVPQADRGLRARERRADGRHRRRAGRCSRATAKSS